MAKQTGNILLYGTLVGACGYVMQGGNAILARKPGPKAGRKRWSGRIEAERKKFSAISQAGGHIWRRLPGRLRLLAGEHGYHSFLRGMLLGNERLAGFCLNPDVPVDGVACLAVGRGGLIGEDIGLTGLGFPKAVVVQGDKDLGWYPGATGGQRGADLLPAGGHHVTGGIGRARSKARRKVLARVWNAGDGLRDRREMEAAKRESVAWQKGFESANDWFQAMAAHLGGGKGLQESVPGEGRVLKRVVVGCVGGRRFAGGIGSPLPSRGSWSWQGDWQSADTGVEVELPRWKTGAVFVGVEFGYLRRGVVVPLQCLNRVWCIGLWPEEVKQDRSPGAVFSRVLPNGPEIVVGDFVHGVGLPAYEMGYGP